MRPLFKAARLVLPLMLFGYGAVANLAVLSGPPTALTLPRSDLLAGGLTRDFERLYKSTLPHFALSFGWIGAARYALLGEARSGAVVGQDGWLFTREETRPLPSADLREAAIDEIVAIQAVLAAQGTRLVLVPLPAKIDIGARHTPDPALSATMAALDADFIARLNRASIEVVDPRAVLLAQAEDVFFATDTHWTRLGASLTAGALAAYLPRGPLTFAEGPAIDKPLIGDLIRFVTEDSLAPMIGLPPERVTLVPIRSDAPVTDIFAAAPIDVVLIGTSYSANTDWGFADALTKALGREVENLAEIGLGPVAPMRHYLGGDAFAQTPAQVVIWEFPIRYLSDPDLWTAPLSDPSQPDQTHPNFVASNG